jgi:DNA-binding transcriptional LysR family regulator
MASPALPVLDTILMNWDDLRIIAAVRDKGSYAGAGARLRLDETTVARRMARIQGALGVTLFDAVDGIRKPTAHCEAILGHVHEIARHVAEIGTVGKTAQGAVGRFRIASTSSIAEAILAPRAAPFLLANPGLTLQFMTSGENVNFSRWEADLAVRLRKPERGDFTISKLADIRLYLFEPAAIRDPAGGPVLCCYPEDLDHSPDSRYLVARGLYAQARCIAENLRIVRALIESHAATGILPEHMCDGLLGDPALRVTPLERRQDVWLLVQNHLKRDPAARTVIDWLRESFGALAAR